MKYITGRVSPGMPQITFEELLFGDDNDPRFQPRFRRTDLTRTYEVESISKKLAERVRPDQLLYYLKKFNEQTEFLRSVPRSEHYDSFKIPKRSGGFRPIDAPDEALSAALRQLKALFEDEFGALYHASAHAYIKERSTVSALKVHQRNESRWFAKLDLHNFFGSHTLPYVMDQLSMIFPFCEVVSLDGGRAELEKALELAFYKGGLPQGTPISPMLTNLCMIPLDYKLSQACRELDGQKLVVTRYADDFLISSKYQFELKQAERLVQDVLNEFHAPFQLNKKKSRLGTSSGRNWNLGLMLNQNNEITVGHKNKRNFEHALFNFVQDQRHGVYWSKEDAQHLMGLYSYYRMVEREAIDRIVAHLDQKQGVDSIVMLKRAV
jgi:hypothetical protein